MAHRRLRKNNYSWGNPYVAGIITARVAVALSIFWFPWWGLMASYVLDVIDSWFLMQKAGYTRHMYHLVDKWLDWVCYAVEYVIAVRFGMGLIFTVLLVWRLAGHLLFVKTHKPEYFLLAPNMFEILYMWIIAAPLEHITDGLARPVYWNIFILLVIGKYIQEAWLHIIWPWYLKKYGFPDFAKRFGYHNVGY